MRDFPPPYAAADAEPASRPEAAMAAIRAALAPFRTVAIVIDFKWYERPRRLWARRALHRTARIL